jgi:hypothetical protein
MMDLALNISIFLSSIILTNLLSRYFKEAWLVIKLKNKKREIRIHHFYIGYILSTLGFLVNQIYLILIGLGILMDDAIKEIKKKLR